MTEMNDYDENTEDSAVDDEEAKAAESGAETEEATYEEANLAKAETLTVTAKQKERQALEDELAAFLARGGRITEVQPGEHQD